MPEEKGERNMSNPTKTAPDTAVETEPAVSVSPDEIVSELRAIRERIAALKEPVVASSPKSRLAHVDANFVQASVNAVGVSDVAQLALGRTDEELRQDIDAAVRWSAVTDELRALLQAAAAVHTARRQRIGLAALQTYRICRELARDPKNAHLTAHIAEMRRLNQFGKARRKATPPPPQTK
jgi:hypothetical protein